MSSSGIRSPEIYHPKPPISLHKYSRDSPMKIYSPIQISSRRNLVELMEQELRPNSQGRNHP